MDKLFPITRLIIIITVIAIDFFLKQIAFLNQKKTEDFL